MQPLEGVQVLDLTRVLSGPFCTMVLADMGARVIKIEQPGRGDDTRGWGPPFLNGESAYFLSINRNKESVTLDIKSAEGRRLLDALVARADVLVENFRPGTLDRMGLGYGAVAEAHPRLIYCSISGFGQTGPRRDEPGYDAVMQAEGGLMSITGSPEGPPYRLGVAIADIVSGMFAAQGVTLALYARERTGRGTHVDIGMLDAVSSLLTYQAGIYFATATAPGRLGNRHPTIVPYETFRATDGDFVIAAGNDALFRRLCTATGLDELAADPRFATNADRVKRHAELMPLLAQRLACHTREHWLTKLKAAGVPCGSVRDLHELFSDPQLLARNMVEDITHPTIGALKLLGTPIKLDNAQSAVRSAPPLLGQHTEAVLTGDLGLTHTQIEALKAAGAI